MDRGRAKKKRIIKVDSRTELHPIPILSCVVRACRLPPLRFRLAHRLLPLPSQRKVGGHTRKPARKTVSGGGSRARSGGGGDNGGADDWRLTAAQKVTLLEAYSENTGTAAYIPDAVSGWRRQKSLWATGKVRSKKVLSC